jgi:hypothetical protein
VPTDSSWPRRRLGWFAGIVSACLAIFAFLASEANSAAGPPRFVQAQGLADDTVAIAWTAETGAAGYRVYRDGAQVADQPGTSYEDRPLQPGTTHTYAVSSVSGGVESALSMPVIATTQDPADTTPPTQPGAIAVLDVTASSVEMDWSSSSDNVDIVGYRILRGPPGALPSQLVQIATTDGSSQFEAKNLRSGTSYQFGVVALDAQNNHSPIRTVTVTTRSNSDATPPVAPPNGSVRTIPFSSSRIDVTWGTSTSTDIASYRVYRDGIQVGDVAQPLRKTFSDVGLTPGQSYSYTIRTVDWAGNVSSPTTAKIGTTPASGTVLIPRGPYLQWVTSTSARIVWWTNLQTASVVEYGLGVFSDVASESVPRYQHMMLIGGLTPGTTYQYRVGDGNVASSTYNFTTAAATGTAFSFAAVGDFGGGSPGETAVANSIAASDAQFTQTVGDNVYPDSQDPDFTTFYSDFDSRLFKQYAQVINKQSFWPANGNKEYYGDGAHWRIFSLPNNERWYSYDWGDAHILVLDSEQPYTPGSPQYQFAESDLSANQAKTWRIVVFHKPPFSSTSNNSSAEGAQTYLVPLFEQQRVQLVLSGDSHNYERSYPLLGGQPASRGVTYVVTGGGGNGHNPFTIPQPAWSAFRDDTAYEYVRVSISPQTLQLAAIRGSDGVTLDSAVIDAPPELTYARPKGASPTTFTLVPAFSPCTTANAQHGASLSVASCTSPSQTSSHLTMNAPDRPAPFNTRPDGIASVTLKTTCLVPGTTAEYGESPPCPLVGDQADVKITSTFDGVRCASAGGGCDTAGGTYAGKLLAVLSIRITDMFNGSGQDKAGTAIDYPLSWGAQCTAGSCDVTTSADAVLPSLVQEQERAIWQLGEMQVLDGGPDGDLATVWGSCPPACAGNGGEEVFLQQGLFAP